MSLAIVILMDSGAIVFTDSRSVTPDFSKSENGVKKSIILKHNHEYAIVAFTGEGIINCKLTLEILTESAATNARVTDLPMSLVTSLKSAFDTDVATGAWESETERQTYLKEAKVILHILTAPNKHCIWVVTPTKIENYPFQNGANEAFSGVRNIDCFTGSKRDWDLQSVRSLLPNCINKLCMTEATCGYPIDVTVWKFGNSPGLTRCADLNTLKAHLASLVM